MLRIYYGVSAPLSLPRDMSALRLFGMPRGRLVPPSSRPHDCLGSTSHPTLKSSLKLLSCVTSLPLPLYVSVGCRGGDYVTHCFPTKNWSAHPSYCKTECIISPRLACCRLGHLRTRPLPPPPLTITPNITPKMTGLSPSTTSAPFWHRRTACKSLKFAMPHARGLYLSYE